MNHNVVNLRSVYCEKEIKKLVRKKTHFVAIIQCCQIYFHIKILIWVNFAKSCMSVFSMNILSILRLNVIFYGDLVHFVVFWYSFSRIGMSGNPGFTKVFTIQ
jgi:hypothetical protein